MLLCTVAVTIACPLTDRITSLAHARTSLPLSSSDATNAVLVPLLLRACDSTSPRAQEEALRSVHRAAQSVAPEALRGALVPKVVATALRTTSAGVRAAALGVLAGVAQRLDRAAADGVMDVCAQVSVMGSGVGAQHLLGPPHTRRAVAKTA